LTSCKIVQREVNCPVSLAQLVETLHYICRGRSSNPGHSTYPLYKAKFLTNRLLEKKKTIPL
jgi:hypothetical protein